MKLICKTKFGSQLYGTVTPTSDVDIRGVFIPSSKDILLGRIPRTNHDNGGTDTDFELYSLHHFVKLACQGQTVALDMLWTPDEHVMKGECYDVWKSLVKNREKFLSKNMNAFIGYARGQATKYSLKGERLKKLGDFYAVLLLANNPYSPMSMLWDYLPKDDERTNPQGIRELQISGKWFGESTSISNVKQVISDTIANYGKRAKDASTDSVDWKAMSHAVRVSLELRELLETRNIIFPLTHHSWVLDIKLGKLSLEEVQDTLDKLLSDIERLSKISDLPDKVNQDFWDNWLFHAVKDNLELPVLNTGWSNGSNSKFV